MDKMFNDRTGDPLLFLRDDKSDLESFILTGGDLDRINNEDLQVHANDDSLDFNALEGNGQLGDVNWLHSASLAALTHLDNDDTSDGSTMIPVNPQSVIPMQIIEPSKPDNLMSSENANSAAMRLHANCSNLIGSDSPEEKKTANSSILTQDHPSIRILSVAGTLDTVNSPVKPTNYIITSSRQSPLKSQTFVLNTASGVLTPEQNVTTVSYRSATLPSTAGNIVLASPQKIHALSTDNNGRVLLKTGLSPSQASPVLLGHLQTGVQPPPQVFQNAQALSTNMITSTQPQSSDTATVSSTTTYGEDRAYPKPVFSYSCLIALALKNSRNGSLPVSEIYNFMCENFPYFKTAPDGWKNSVRHNLSLNKCFAKVDNPKMSQGAKKGCLWALNPAKIAKMEEEISKWGKKDPVGLLSSMAYPENLEAIEKGQAGLHYSKNESPDSLSTPIKDEATPTKAEYSPMVEHEFFPITVESHQSHTIIPTHTLPPQHVTPVKVRQLDHTPVKVRQLDQHSTPVRSHPYSPSVHKNRTHTSSPMSNINVYNHHSPMKASSTADPGTKSLSISDIHSTINTDALTDIVLQNGMWESEDLENEIDIDLICDSPSSHLLLPIQSPLPSGTSPNTVQTSSFNSDYCNPSTRSPHIFSNSIVQVQRQSPQIFQRQLSPLSHVQRQSPLSHVVQRQSPLSHLQRHSPHIVQRPLPHSSPTSNSVRNNLFGVSTTPTLQILHT